MWTILAIHRNGSAEARRHRDSATVTLPGDYLAEHAHLGYATTAHHAQGMTVDVSHALATAGDSHEQLYVAAHQTIHDSQHDIASLARLGAPSTKTPAAAPPASGPPPRLPSMASTPPAIRNGPPWSPRSGNSRWRATTSSNFSPG